MAAEMQEKDQSLAPSSLFDYKAEVIRDAKSTILGEEFPASTSLVIVPAS